MTISPKFYLGKREMRTAFEFILEYIKKLAKRRILLSQSLRYIYNLVFGRIQKVQIYETSGFIEGANDKIALLFVGKEHCAHQFASLVYRQIDKTLLIEELRFSQITSVLKTTTHEIIAVNVEKPRANEFEKQGYLLLPDISFKLDLHIPIDEIIIKMSKRRRRDVKKIEAANYSYIISKESDDDFNFFYWKMYLPYATQRFGKAAYIKKYNESKAFYKTGGGIIFVRKCEKLVAGILFRAVGKTLYAISLGLCQQGEKFAEQRASQAALLFLIKWAKMNGMASLDYGTSLPFFREGVFTYKKEWGMSVTEPIDQSYCALKLNSPNAGFISFLQQNPFIISDNGILKGVVLLDHKPTKEELTQTFSEYFLPRLNSIIFIAYYKSNAKLLDKDEPLTKSIGFSPVLSKPLLDICLLLKEKFKVEALELAYKMGKNKLASISRNS
jgi:hypothetical protein